MPRLNITPITRHYNIFTHPSISLSHHHHPTLPPPLSFRHVTTSLPSLPSTFTPPSLQPPFIRTYTLIPSHNLQDATDPFDHTPHGHLPYLTSHHNNNNNNNNNDNGHHNNDDNDDKNDQMGEKINGCVPVSSNGEKLYNIIVECKVNDQENGGGMEMLLNEAGVELTTPLVMEVLGCLRYMEKLAFRFFTWAGKQERYGHEAEAYNEMIDILSNTKYKAKQYRVVCDVLDYMKRSGKRCVTVDALLKILREYADKHLAHLHKFAKKKKVKLKVMQPEIDAFNVLLDAFCKCCLVEDGESMFMRIKSKVKPNASTYNILFFGWCRVRNPTRSMQILDEMIAMGYTPENFTYNTAIDTFCKSGMLSEAGELLEFMKSKGTLMSSPTAKTYAIMIIAYARNDRMDECFKVVDSMLTSGCLPDVSTYREIIEGMCAAGKVEGAYKFLEDMKKMGYPPDIVTYNCFLKVLCDHKDSEEALRLYKKMIEVGCKPSVQTFNMLVVMFFKMDDPNGALEIWREMDNRRCVRDTASYCVMIEGLFGCERTQEACDLLDKVLNMGIKLPYQKFDSFLMQLSSIGDLRAINRLSEHMRKFYNPVMARRFALNQKRKSVSLRGK